MKQILTLFIVLIGIEIFAQTAEPNFSLSSIESSKTWLDIDYVGDGIIGHKLDVFLPKKGKAPFPIIVTIYGSAWFSNSAKGSVFKDGFGQALLNNGFAVVSINHRSSTDAVWPAQLHDIKAAVRFIRANATKFSLDSSFVGVSGFSSGGHLSAMLGVSSHLKNTKIGSLDIDLEGNIGKNANSSSYVNAVVDWFGPTNFITMDSCGSSFKHDEIKSPESSLIGGAIQDNKDKVALANPMSYVSKNTVPFLIIHGTNDKLVPYCQSQELYQKMQQLNVPSQFITVDGGGHGPGVMIEKYYEQMVDFFKTQKKQNAKIKF
jgi:acetyl esterase/lipase